MKYITKVTITQSRVTVEFPNKRTLEASRDFFDFVGTKIATPQWTIPDLANDDDVFRIGCGSTKMDSERNESIWFQTKYFDGCGITTAYEWFLNPNKIGEKVKGKRLPNNQMVGDTHIILP
ncbi:hypothetical protein [[Limnothrix rosea] IAM M-220]|uniref:hypothetical protein n=1 Tax=[Limnothrix rosea] IAM M-220 TaxID=454133 RepID=UPI000962C24D|nr:hypothetical protein [[Limnothrix rosea] IAM M-220]OKH13834.1 hypothetical protein NIES208_14480 [[Limnothrix rosea] IAM M-220]